MIPILALPRRERDPVSVLALDGRSDRMRLRDPCEVRRIERRHRKRPPVDEYAILPQLDRLPGQPDNALEKPQLQVRIVREPEEDKVPSRRRPRPKESRV